MAVYTIKKLKNAKEEVLFEASTVQEIDKELLDRNFTGKLKIFQDGELIFKGEFLNGKRNGKGTEYKKGAISKIFEGEYKNGQRHGQGKEYYDNGKIKYEGEYFNGERRLKNDDEISLNDIQIGFDCMKK